VYKKYTRRNTQQDHEPREKSTKGCKVRGVKKGIN
jgi:hypothetical protein